MNILLKAKTFFIFPILLLTFCASPEKPKGENYHELIRRVIAEDEPYLQAFKVRHEKNWETKNWKLVNSRIDAFEGQLVIKDKDGDKESIVPDTNCILEWNYKFGKIRRETYNSKFVADNIVVLYYNKDSIYAHGDLQTFSNSELKMFHLTYFKNKLVCKPCNDFSYTDYLSSGDSTGRLYEEYQFLDSLNNVQCSYRSPKFGIWSWQERNGNIKITCTSDSAITTTGSCPSVELKEE